LRKATPTTRASTSANGTTGTRGVRHRGWRALVPILFDLPPDNLRQPVFHIGA